MLSMMSVSEAGEGSCLESHVLRRTSSGTLSSNASTLMGGNAGVEMQGGGRAAKERVVGGGFPSYSSSVDLQARTRGTSLDDDFQQHHFHHQQQQQQQPSNENYFLSSTSYTDNHHGYNQYLRQPTATASFYHTDSPPYSPAQHELSLADDAGRALPTAFVTSAPPCPSTLSPSSPFTYPISWTTSAHAQALLAVASPTHFDASDVCTTTALASTITATSSPGLSNAEASRRQKKMKKRAQVAARISAPPALALQQSTHIIGQSYGPVITPYATHHHHSTLARDLHHRIDHHHSSHHGQFLAQDPAYSCCSPSPADPFSCFSQHQPLQRHVRGYLDMADPEGVAGSNYPLSPAATLPSSPAGYQVRGTAPTRPSAPPPPPKMSEVDCYTCRRRRVKCDRQLPHCAKCERTKLECLGYKKPLVWNKGVASRGKMMGKTYPTPPVTVETAAAQSSAKRKTTAAKASGSSEKKKQAAVVETKPPVVKVDTAVIPRHAPTIRIPPSQLPHLNGDSHFYLNYCTTPYTMGPAPTSSINPQPQH
ncbi:hypothetical protein EX30DRAFT_175841 [Ascodesmis nigricans]|uniref:Zn(2)-C6 fungal-type domain-containing protein n=1 Tax=Ascodesmis nigricans TaxID=341454 RepID=A0A4S2MRS6_9PEZI|nr:hypothetical protein EX30DRAFT_175841 [Ascodesmis nigricans]